MAKKKRVTKKRRAVDVKPKRRIISGKLIFSLITLILGVYYYSEIEEKPVNSWEYKSNYEILVASPPRYPILHGELAVISDSTYFVRSQAGRYSFMYSPAKGYSDWVAYRLTRDNVKTKGTTRSDKFYVDEYVTARGWRTATTDDYYRSSFDRGHLLPSADRDDTKSENEATFSLANVAPQYAGLNRGVWLMLEEKVREWAYSYGDIYVIVGVVAGRSDKIIGKNKIPVPESFFKCIATKYDGRWCSVGYVIPNESNPSKILSDYRMSVDKVERIVGIDFFPHIEKVADADFERVVFGGSFR